MDLSIFKAFNFAIIYDVWQIGTCRHGSVVGNIFSKVADIDVVIDEENSSSISTTPENLQNTMLIYAKPEQLPTLNTNKLVSDYMLYDSENGFYYMITNAGIGKNQHNGTIEHIELQLVQTDIVEVPNE